MDGNLPDVYPDVGRGCVADSTIGVDYDPGGGSMSELHSRYPRKREWQVRKHSKVIRLPRDGRSPARAAGMSTFSARGKIVLLKENFLCRVVLNFVFCCLK